MIKKKTIALFGVAGSGKTTKCLELIQKYLQEYELSDIAFTTYTRAGIESIKQKLESADIFLPDDNNFGTMHSLCWKLAQFEHKILTFRKYKDFCIEHKIEIEREEEEDKTIGEYLLEVYEFIQNIKAKKVASVSAGEINKILLEKYQEDEKITQIERDNLIRLLGVFIKWKEKKGLYVYSDALIEVLENRIDVPAHVLIVDEAQDLFEVQIRIIKMWTEEHDKDIFILAGDDDQAVHAWAGSDPSYLIENAKVADEKIILEKTYRCPPAVTKICNKILKEIKYREPKKDPCAKNRGCVEAY